MAPLSENEALRLVPLGGLGEFGLNALVIECSEGLLLLDAGVMFPGAEMLGVDSVVPDFRYLAERQDRLRGIVLTHGHEDHIGALSFALQAASAPVYGSRLTLGFARRRLQERGVSADLRVLSPGRPEEIGPFRVHAIRVAHSVLDSLAVAVETPRGVILASGDFRMGGGVSDEDRTDAEAFARWGDRGVLALLSDSTNVEWPGLTGSEDDVIPALEEVFARTRGRVLVSCFATSIPRIQRAADIARRAGRAIAFVGRRMAQNAEVALDLGLLRIPSSDILPTGALASAAPEKMCIFVSGSQAEPLSALSTIGLGGHREVAIGPGDTVVLSARVIPGHERAVSRLIGNLFRRGSEVVHPGTARVHVSGHGSRGDLAELLRLTRPQYLVPVHGEYRMLVQHARLGREVGLSADRVLLVEDGEALAFGPDGAWRAPRVPTGRVLLDRSGANGLEELVIRDRRHLSTDGIVVPIVVVDKESGRVEGAPEIVTRGFVDWGERAGLLEEAARLAVVAVEARSAQEQADPALTREKLKAELRRLFKKRTQRRPMVIPVVMEV